MIHIRHTYKEKKKSVHKSPTKSILNTVHFKIPGIESSPFRMNHVKYEISTSINRLTGHGSTPHFIKIERKWAQKCVLSHTTVTLKDG